MLKKPEPEPGTAAHFLRRRDRWIRWVLEADLTPMAKVVGVHLAMRMNVRDQVAWPNVKTMARALDVSDRQVRRCIAELEEGDALRVSRKGGKGNHYYLLSPMDP